MKKMLGIIGGLSLMSSISGSVVSCSESVDYSFNLTTERRQVIDTFDKREVEDYYFKSWNNIDNTTEVTINFKKTGAKDYGSRSGDCAYWLGHLVRGLGQKPNQSKYIKEGELWPQEIPRWAWKDAGLWDWDNDRPKD